jgi:hypothetical protein
MTLMGVAFADHSPDRVYVGAVQFVAHHCRPSHPGYPKMFLGSIWVQPIADIGPLSAEAYYSFPYSSDSDQLADAPLPVPFLYPSPYNRDDAGQFHPSPGPGGVGIDETRMATLYRSLDDAIAHRERLNRWLTDRGGKGSPIIMSTGH